MMPSKDKTYTLRQVLQLDLKDTPTLTFVHKNRVCVIQTSHVTDENLLAVPGLADTEWQYQRTTYEWIPIFRAVDSEEVTKCLDIEPCESDAYYGDDEVSYWCTPKGHHRKQTYHPIEAY